MKEGSDDIGTLRLKRLQIKVGGCEKKKKKKRKKQTNTLAYMFGATDRSRKR